jgi:phosphomannomutase
VYATDQLSVRVQDLSLIGAAMTRLRELPPSELAGSAVTEVVDLSTGVDGLPPTDGLRYLTKLGDRVIVRPSGTEPKLKCYLEVIVPVEGDDVGRARTQAAGRLARLRADIATAVGL